MQKVLAEINLAHLRSNARLFSERTKRPLYAVVKADAYGHGAEEIALALVGQVKGFAVSLIEEGLTIQTAACGREILVFTPPMDERELAQMQKSGLIATVASLDCAKMLDGVCKKNKRPLRVHIKCNTGMNRYGVELSEMQAVCRLLQSNPYVAVEGLYSHLYAHKEKTAKNQRLRFLEAQAVCKTYFPTVCCHLSATYGALLGEEFAFDAVRIGIGLYGYLPDDIPTSWLPLKKVMQIKAQCTEERIYAFGGAGYAPCSMKVGEKMQTFRCGYADGLAYVKAQQELPVLSAPCMDACVCCETEVQEGEWKAVMTDARECAKTARTIGYEILCRATARAECVYGYDG